MARWIKRILALMTAIVVVGVGIGFVIHEDRPTGQPGAPADALARRIEEAVNRAAWEQTGAVQWTFVDHQHLWDRNRNLARVEWNDTVALLRLGNRSGRVFRGHQEVEDNERGEALKTAYRYFLNDSFWLNPLVKLFDDGVRREVVTMENGRDALLVTYTSGGTTPGDSYLWIVDDEGLPFAWKMWVQIIPIGGIEVSWGGWQRLSTGALISTSHRAGPFRLELTDVEGTRSLDTLHPSGDPFERLFAE